MGHWFSKNEEVQENKTVEANGGVNNNMVVSETFNTTRMEVLLLILCILRLLEFFYFVYSTHTRKIKKKYSGSMSAISSNRT